MAQADLRSDPRALIWTVGHGTRATESLADLLRAAGVTTVIDVRRYPEGRRQPHLSRKRLEVDLPRLDLRYEWWGEALGGRRPAPPASATPSPWRSPGFAAYAAYMLTDVFRVALSTLEGRAVAGEAPRGHVRRDPLVALPPAVDRRCARVRRVRSPPPNQ